MSGARQLRLRDVTLRGGGTLTLHAVRWTHGPGRVGWVRGENGSGKSTLLRALARRLRPEEGVIEWPTRSGSGTCVVAYLHPRMRAPAEVTVADWNRLLDALQRSSADAWDPPCLAPPDLGPGQRLGQLSTGEAKRLLLDAVLRRPADLYVLDEPYEHLSPDSKVLLSTRLEELAAKAVVVVATNQIVAGVDSRALRLLGEARWTVETAGVGQGSA